MSAETKTSPQSETHPAESQGARLQAASARASAFDSDSEVIVEHWFSFEYDAPEPGESREAYSQRLEMEFADQLWGHISGLEDPGCMALIVDEAVDKALCQVGGDAVWPG